ncbi:MAG: ABC transporter permease, partial [Acidimicrobiia bacterium]|nr:ABC transporter permease [Acidimicrobiia bacterium]
MRVWAIARINLVRFFRDRSSIFSVFVLPMAIVLMLGAASGGASTPKVGFVATDGDALTAELLVSLQGVEGLDVVEVDTDESAVRQVERGGLQAAVILPTGYEQTLRSGDDAEIRFVARAEQQLQTVNGVITAAVTRQATLLRTARFAVGRGAGAFDEALAAAEQVQARMPSVD